MNLLVILTIVIVVIVLLNTQRTERFEDAYTACGNSFGTPVSSLDDPQQLDIIDADARAGLYSNFEIAGLYLSQAHRQNIKNIF